MKCVRIIMLILAFAGCLILAPRTGAQDAVPLNVAILDLNRIYRDSVAAQRIHDLVNSHAASYREDTERAEVELRNADRILAERRTLEALSAEEFDQERRKLEQRVQESQKKVQERRRSLAKLQAEGLQELETVLKQVVEQLRKERGFTLILRSEHTAYVDPSLDITDEVLRLLNQQLPTVSVGTDENSGLRPREN